jgi:CPA2 family monovalent cation:H+ antiporter-2
MLFNPAYLVEAPMLVAFTLAIVLVGKSLVALGIVSLLGYPLRTSLAVAVSLAQIGEFSFIVGLLGHQLGILPEAATNTIVATAIVSITLNPLLYRLMGPAAARLAGRPGPPGDAPAPADRPARRAQRHRAVVVGSGPVGRTVARLLRENDIEPTIIELNLETVRRLREEGLRAIYGDAGHRGTLASAGVAEAGSLILSSSGLSDGEAVIRLARELNPDIQVLARATYVRELPALRQAGAETFSGEGEVALALTVALLERLGATPEQIDRERERVHAELLDAADEGRVKGPSSRS